MFLKKSILPLSGIIQLSFILILSIMNLSFIPSFKTVLFYCLLSICVILALYINLLGAWNHDALWLTASASIACTIAVIPSVWCYHYLFSTKKNALDLGTPKKLLAKLASAVVAFSIFGSACSYCIGRAYYGAYKDPLFTTTLNGVGKGVDSSFKNNILNIDSIKLSFPSDMLFVICYKFERNTYPKDLTTERTAELTISSEKQAFEESKKRTAFFITFIRNFPEALSATFVFLAWLAIWANWKKREELEEKNNELEAKNKEVWLKNQEIIATNEILAEKNKEIALQNREIKWSNLTRDLLTRTDFIHAIINVSRDTRSGLRKILSKKLQPMPPEIETILYIQEEVANFQRFRYSLLQERSDFILLREEFKYIETLKRIITLRNPAISFYEDIDHETLLEKNYLIVSGIMSELVFNAYKYSPSSSIEGGIKIKMELSFVKNAVYFCIENPIEETDLSKNNQNNYEYGTGLQLIQQRLELAGYDENSYSFKTNLIAGNPGVFSVKLIVPIKEH
jgi:hypothetical protein